jgi:hypothetical protein
MAKTTRYRGSKNKRRENRSPADSQRVEEDAYAVVGGIG